MHPTRLLDHARAAVHRPRRGIVARLALLAFAAILLAAPRPAPAQPDPLNYPMGANVVPAGDGGGVVFRVWAPNATSINIPGQFNAWNTNGAPATKDAATGIWSAWVPTAAVNQQYKIFVRAPDFSNDGQRWQIDPWSRDTVNTTDNSIIRGDGSTYNWQATDWVIPDREAMVIYELHVGTFSGNGDGAPAYPARYRDVVDFHLDDLLALGVNMVEIMPIHEFPATSWGYNPVHFYAPESDYGTPDDLRYMVDRLHQNGIGTIVDVVYNHTSNTDNNLWEFDGAQNIYFFGNNCQGETPWGSTRPKYTEQQVRAFLIENARYWIEEFRMDGIRVDATAFMRGYCNEQGEGWSLMGAIANAVHAANPRAIVIAEELPNTGAVTRPTNQGGAGFDAQWGDLFHDAMREQMGVLGSGANANLGRLRDAIVESGFDGPNSAAIKYSESHDEAGAANGGSRLTHVIDSAAPFSDKAKGLSKIAGGLALVSPGIPMLFMGQEFLEDKPFGDGSGDRIWWGFLNTYGEIRDYYGAVARLRTARGSLRSTSSVQVSHFNDGADVIAFQRFDLAGDVTLVVVNFSATNFATYRVGFPTAGTWYELVNSQDVRYQGSGPINATVNAAGPGQDGFPAAADIALAPWTLAIFSKTALPVEEQTAGVLLR